MDSPISRSDLASASDFHSRQQGSARPVSRALESRPGSLYRDVSGRPPTSGRPITSRPLSSALRGAPGTASRLISTASQRVSARAGLTTGIGINNPINVVDRPITQQGLSGMQSAAKGPQRQIQDKSYYMGLLRTKMTEISNEISRLNGDIDAMSEEQSTFLTYDKRVKEVAQELTELQGTLADYNLLVDLVNTDAEKTEVIEELRELKEANEEEAAKLDSLFTRKHEMDNIIKQLEYEIEEESHMGESLVAAMKPELQQRYMELRNNNISLLHKLNQMQHEIDNLDSQANNLQDELSLSKVKQEVVNLYLKLQELQQKREEILEENRKRGTPTEERERLLLQVKEDNSEVAAMERQIGEAQDDLRKIKEDIDNMDKELDENRSERTQKYRELRKREEAMEQFLSAFEESRNEELQRIEHTEKSVVDLLEKISRNMAYFGHLPSSRELDEMRNDLSFKEGELKKSQYTEQSIKTEHLNLQANLQKIEALEVKVKKEMEELKEKYDKMENEIMEMSDLDGLRTKTEEKRRQLSQEKGELDDRRVAINQALEEVTTEINRLKKQLNDNETYAQLSNLEKKWASLEQNNFALKEYVAQKRADTNFATLKSQALKLVDEYNTDLQDLIQKGGTLYYY